MQLIMSLRKMWEEMEEGIRAFLSFLSEKLSKTMEAKGKEQTRGLQEAPGF